MISGAILPRTRAVDFGEILLPRTVECSDLSTNEICSAVEIKNGCLSKGDENLSAVEWVLSSYFFR